MILYQTVLYNTPIAIAYNDPHYSGNTKSDFATWHACLTKIRDFATVLFFTVYGVRYIVRTYNL